MSQLNLGPMSGFFSIELVTSAVVPPAGDAGQAVSFDRYLQQATAAAQPGTGADRPPPPESPPQDEEDAAGPIDAVSSQDDRPACAEATSDSDRQAGPSESGSEIDNESEVSGAEPASDEQSEPNEEDEAEEQPSETDSTCPVGPLDVEALGQLDNQEASGADSAVDAVTDEGQGGASEATQEKITSSASVNPTLDESEPSGPIRIPTEEADKSPAPRESRDVEPAHVQEDETPDAGRARPSDGPDETGPETDQGASQPQVATGPEAENTPAPREASPSGPRRQARSSPAGVRPDAGRLDEQGAKVETQRAQQDSRVASPVEAPEGIESRGNENAPTGPVSVETSEAEGGTPVRAWANQGTRPASTAPGRESSGSEQADRVRFVQRVARAFETMGDRGGTLRLRLHPPELGSLRLQVTVRNGAMTARLEVESDSARTMLLDNFPALRDRLAQQNIRVDRFDVDLHDRSAGGTPQGPGDQAQPHGRPDLRSPDPRTERELEAERPLEPRAIRSPEQGNQLDVVV